MPAASCKTFFRGAGPPPRRAPRSVPLAVAGQVPELPRISLGGTKKPGRTSPCSVSRRIHSASLTSVFFLP